MLQRRNVKLVSQRVQLRFEAVADLVGLVDADLGLSGADAAGREGFQHLVSEVALGNVGLIVGVEVSRAGAR